MGKTFTLEGANKALVFVAPVTHEIQSIWNSLMGLQGNSDGSSESVIRAKLNRLKTCNEELAYVGCMLRDPVEGIVDFPSFYRNQPIFLNWKIGEEQIMSWHHVHETFNDRRLVDDDFLGWNSKEPIPDLNVA